MKNYLEGGGEARIVELQLDGERALTVVNDFPVFDSSLAQFRVVELEGNVEHSLSGVENSEVEV